MQNELRKLIEGTDYFIYLVEMPRGIYACVVKNPDTTYSVYLDPRRSFDQLMQDLDHELRHIIRDDFYNGLPIYIVEAA